MNRWRRWLLVPLLVVVTAVALGLAGSTGTAAALGLAGSTGTAAAAPSTTPQACTKPHFLGFIPSWYEYLPLNTDSDGHCEVDVHFYDSNHVLDLSPVLAVALAVLDALLRIAGVVTLGFVIYGAFRYLTSQGEPENTEAALDTILHAFIGLVIAIIAASIVAFVGHKLGG